MVGHAGTSKLLGVLRTISMIAGIITLVATIFVAQKSLVSFAGGAADMRRRALALTVIPYLAIGLINVWCVFTT